MFFKGSPLLAHGRSPSQDCDLLLTALVLAFTQNAAHVELVRTRLCVLLNHRALCTEKKNDVTIGRGQ